MIEANPMNSLMFFILALFWGCSFIAIRLTLVTFPPFMAAGFRIFAAALIIWGLCLYQKRPNTITHRQSYRVFWLGILNFGIPWATLFWGEQFVHPSIASIINSSVPIFVLIFSWFMLADEQPNLSSTIGVLLGFLGMYMVFSPNVQLQGTHSKEVAGMFSILVMAVSYGLGAVGIKRLPKSTDMRWAFILQGLSASVFLFALSFLQGEKIVDTSKMYQSIGGLAYLAIFSSAIASLMFYHLIGQWGALKATAVTYVAPFVALVADIIFLGVHPKPNELMGGMMIIVGLLLIHWAKTKNVHKTIGSLFRKKQSL